MSKQSIIQLKLNGENWLITHTEKNAYFPDNKTIAMVSGVWLCKSGYPWKFSYYRGENLDIAIKQLRKKYG